MEASLMSGTSASREAERETNTTLAEGKTAPVDSIFPFIDALNTYGEVPDFITLAILLYWEMQVFFVCWWPSVNCFLKSRSLESKILTWGQKIFFITPNPSGDDQSTLITFIIFIALFALAIIILAINLTYHRKKHTLISWLSKPTRFMIERIPLAVFIPISYQISGLLNALIYEGTSAKNIGFLVGDVIILLAFSGIFALFGMFSANSAYLQSGLFASYDFKSVVMFVLSTPIFLILISALQQLPSWFIIPVLFGHIAFNIYIAVVALELPFVIQVANCFFIGLVVSLIPMDALVLVSYFFNVKPVNWLTLSFDAAIIILSTVSTLFYQEFRIKKAVKGLAYNGEVNIVKKESVEKFEDVELSASEKIERVEALGLTRPSTMKFYLRTGLANVCDLFTDFSLIRYAIDEYLEKTMLIQIVRIVAYFPPEVRLMSNILYQIMKRRDLNVMDRFLIYQLCNLKLLRQSSSSSSASEKMISMKQQTNTLKSQLLSFWTKSDNKIGSLTHAYESTEQLNRTWLKVLQQYPNSAPFRDEYINFLVECATDFEEAVVQKNACEMIEAGHSFSIDYCYRSMVRTYPAYVKKKIFDIKGNYIHRRGALGKGSHSSNHSEHSSMLFESINARREEELGKSIILQSKMRLVFQKSMDGRKTDVSLYIIAYIFFTFVLGLVIIIYTIYRLSGIFEGEMARFNRLTYLTNSRYYFSLSSLLLFLQWGDNIVPKRINVDPYLYGNLSINPPWDKEAMIASVHFRENLHEYLVLLAEMALEGDDVISIGGSLLKDGSQMRFCYDAYPMSIKNMSQRAMIVQESVHIGILAGNTDYDNWFQTSNEACTIIVNYNTIADDYFTQAETVQGNALKGKKSTDEEVTTTQTIFLTLYVVLAVVLFFILMGMTVFEMIKVLKLTYNIDPKYKKEALEPIRKRTQNDSTITTENIESSHTIVVLSIIVLNLFAVITAIVAAIYLITMDVNDDIVDLTVWISASKMHISYQVETLLMGYLGLWFHGGVDPTLTPRYVSSQMILDSAHASLTKANEYSELLINGDEILNSWVCYDPKLDEFIFHSTCSIINPQTLHDNYRCASSTQVQIFFNNLMRSMIEDVATFNNMVEGEVPENALRLLMQYMMPKAEYASSLMEGLTNERFDWFNTMMYVMMTLAIVVSLVNVVVMAIMTIRVNHAFEGAMVLLRRISPVGIVSNDELMNYLQRKKKSTYSKRDSTSSAVIFNSTDGIIILDVNGTIEDINSAITHMLGYTPEQLLGQNFAIIIHPEESEGLMAHIQMMKAKQSALTYEDHSIIMSDTNAEVPCSTIILGMEDEHQTVKSFVIILRNEEELIKQQAEAEEAKKKSEELLYQILPRDIVNRLNAGEKDVSFSVPIASVMFIDVVKFSEYAAQLAPAEIMGNLGMLFAMFDNAIAKYPLLNKIKLIGDVYMCAAGLFASNESVLEITEQLVKFGFDALAAIEDINLKLNSNLSVRIGMNTGGPLLAGILGTDKPVFDIIGDTINVTARLQSTDVPGNIQVSQATFDVIKDLEIDIEPRGDIFLKGKGNQPAYLIRPPITNIMASLSLGSALMSDRGNQSF